MIVRPIVVRFPGHPKPKGSMVCRRDPMHQLREAVDNAAWRKTVTQWGRKITQHAAPGQPIAIEATYTLERPKGHYGTGRNAGVVKPRYEHATPTGAGTGDVDKLARLLLDVLQDVGVLPNDAQVVELTARKAYTGAGTADSLDYPGLLFRVDAIEVPQ